MELTSLTDQCLLPDSYKYKIINFKNMEGNNCTVLFRVKNIKTEDDVKKWLKDYEEKSKFTWRVARTFKARGHLNIFRRDFRCQHKTDARSRKFQKRTTKNTDCPAIMKIIIKRYADAPNRKKVDAETKMFPCIIELYSWHNHSPNSEFTLRYRDMSASTREKLLHYFEMGHTAATARHALRAELLSENEDNYQLLAADSSIVPSLSKIQHLFNNTIYKTENCRKAMKDFSRRKLEKEMPLQCNLNKSKQLDNTKMSNLSPLLDNNHLDASSSSSDDAPTCNTDMNVSEHEQENSETFSMDIKLSEYLRENIKRKFEECLENLKKRVCYGLEHNSEIYISAVKNMLSNVEKHASTETGLISALHNFATYEKSHTQSMISCKRKSNLRAILPKPVEGEKLSSLVKREMSADHPSLISKIPVNLKEHSNASFNQSPKKTVPHIITFFVQKPT